MSKRGFIFWGMGMALMGLVVGVIFTTNFSELSRAQAVEPVLDIRPVALFGPKEATLPSFSYLAKKVRPAVVNISTTKKIRTQPRSRLPGFGPRDPFDDFFERFFQGPMERPSRSLGSGFVINNEGHILTNNHVIDGAEEITVQLTNKKKYPAEIVGTDPKTDLAIIKIKAKDAPFVTLGNSDALEVGDWVMAVGNPFGLEHTVTAGIVSAKGRVIGAGPYDDFIQTDASINPGNSGGPLFNLKGEVIGVNTAIVASGQGIGFAIPINMAKDLVPQLIKSGKVTRAWLGVGIQEITPELAESFGLKSSSGGLISNVFPESPADKAGFRPGDVVVEFDGKKIRDSHELPAMVARAAVGEKVRVKILREGRETELVVKLGEMEQGQKEAMETTSSKSKELGLAVRDMTPEELNEAGIKLGILVIGVEAGSPADFAGIRRGDILLAVNNVTVAKTSDFRKASQKIKKGKVVRLRVKRDDQTIFLAFTK